VRVLVLGASGFIGSHVAATLAGLGHEVRAGARRPDAAKRLAPAHEWVRADFSELGEPSNWTGLLEGVDAVVNCVGVLQDGAGDSLRAAHVTGPAALIAACATHSRDMAVQNRPWHFGSDGSSPLVRVERVGYTGKLLGELISETYQTELVTLSDWMNQADTRDMVLDARATEMGFSWFQEPSGKLWWTMLLGAAA
jgi:hypothetical protein